jgi:hypothetical protein
MSKRPHYFLRIKIILPKRPHFFIAKAARLIFFFYSSDDIMCDLQKKRKSNQWSKLVGQQHSVRMSLYFIVTKTQKKDKWIRHSSTQSQYITTFCTLVQENTCQNAPTIF